MTESIDFIRISIASYLAIGVLLATVGPAGKVISDEIKRVSNPLLYAVNDQQLPSKKKILLLRILLTLGMILLWSILMTVFSNLFIGLPCNQRCGYQYAKLTMADTRDQP